MARMPGAVWLGEHSPRTPMTAYDIVCVHTIVGYAPAHAAHFSVKASGRILQSRDTAYRSAANLEGNHRVIAIENEDHGDAFGVWSGSNVPALTDAQVESNAEILAWAHETHGVPLQLCPNSRPGSRGLAYHRQGCDGNFTDGFPGRVDGGETWTEHFGKVCPGRNRIAQLPAILERAQGEDPMADYEAQLNRIETQNKAILERLSAAGVIRERLKAIDEELDALATSVADDATKTQVRRLRDRVRALAEPNA
jgi:N-acetylmuramoyl-L-alanine amidase